MLRRLATAVVIVTAALGTMTAESVARPGWDRESECRYARWDGRGGFSTDEVVRTIRCAVAKWAVEGGFAKALDVAECESGSDLMAPTEFGGYSGTYQQAERYWDGRRAHYNPRGWGRELSTHSANPRANVVVSIRMAHAGGWGAWTCA